MKPVCMLYRGGRDVPKRMACRWRPGPWNSSGSSVTCEPMAWSSGSDVSISANGCGDGGV
jgi:hypothetical protein